VLKSDGFRFAFLCSFFSYPIPVEYRIADYSSAATASAGESYISANGSSWEEAYYDGEYFNCCIKAFGTGGEEPAAETGSGMCRQVLKSDGFRFAFLCSFFSYPILFNDPFEVSRHPDSDRG